MPFSSGARHAAAIVAARASTTATLRAATIAASAHKASAPRVSARGIFGSHTRVSGAAARAATSDPYHIQAELVIAGLGDSYSFYPATDVQSFKNTVVLGELNIKPDALRQLARKIDNPNKTNVVTEYLYQLDNAIHNHNERMKWIACCKQDILHAINPKQYPASDDQRWVARAPKVLDLFRPALDAIGLKCEGETYETYSFVAYRAKVDLSAINFDAIPEKLDSNESYNNLLKNLLHSIQDAYQSRESEHDISPSCHATLGTLA